jgi:hypothetical protein
MKKMEKSITELKTEYTKSQQLLAMALKSQYSKYSPSFILQQAENYENWLAVAAVYELLEDYHEFFSYRVKSYLLNHESQISKTSEKVLGLFITLVSTKELSGDTIAQLLLQLMEFWEHYHLDLFLIQKRVMKLTPQLSDALLLLLEVGSVPGLPFSHSTLLRITTQALAQRKAENDACLYRIIKIRFLHSIFSH